MFDPLAYPYVRAQSYLDNNNPTVKSAEFYNPTQDSLALLFGGVLGISASICTEEFDREGTTSDPAASDEAFGSRMSIAGGATNASALATSALGAGDHGIWRVLSSANGAYQLVAHDAESYIDTRNFIWCAKVNFFNGTLADLEAAADSGFVLGLGPLVAGAPDLPVFFCGADTVNWQAGDSTGATDVVAFPIAEGVWYWLIIARLSGTVKWYIKEGPGPLTQVRSAAVAGALTGARRRVEINGSAGAAAGHGFYIDHFSRGLER